MVEEPGYELGADRGAGDRGEDCGDIRAETGGEGEGEGESVESAWTPPFREVVGTWRPEYVEAREDRVVVYGYAEQAVQEFVYTVKATAAGSFAFPPAFGEGMYERSVRAWSQAGRMVVKPK